MLISLCVWIISSSCLILGISCIPTEATGRVVDAAGDLAAHAQDCNGAYDNCFPGAIYLNHPGVTYTKPFTILVEGNIASGKSTFLKHFEKHDNVTILTEPVERWRNVSGWNLLELNTREKLEMTFQTYVILTTLDLHRRHTTTPVKIIERSLYSCRIVFVEYKKRNGMLHPAEFTVLDEWYKYIHQALPVDVDLIVYLRTTPSVAYERRKNRDQYSQSREQQMSLLEDLHQLHEDWLVNKTIGECPAPVLILNGDLNQSQILEEYERNIHKILEKADNVTSSDL